MTAAVSEYNAALERAAGHMAQRTGLNGRIFDLLNEPEQTLLILELRQQAEMSSYMAERDKEAASRHRRELRSLRLQAWETAGGRVFFTQKDDPPLEGRPLTGLWRLDLGSGPLDPAGLVLRSGGEVVGRVPPGLPAFGLPELDLRVLPQLLFYALIISLLGFMEAVSVAKAMAAKTGQRLDPNRELIGQGLGNIAGSFSGGYPVAGSFSRSAVNLQAGARTFLSGVFTSLVVALTLIYFTPFLYHLPLSVLAAVIMLAVVGLINFSGIVHAWRAQKHDGVIAVITFAATLGFAPHLDRGILIGAGLSLLVFLYHSMRPRVALLALGDDSAFHDAPDHGLDLCDRIAVIRFDGAPVLRQRRLFGGQDRRAAPPDAQSAPYPFGLRRDQRDGRLGRGIPLPGGGPGPQRRPQDQPGRGSFERAQNHGEDPSSGQDRSGEHLSHGGRGRGRDPPGGPSGLEGRTICPLQSLCPLGSSCEENEPPENTAGALQEN